MSRVDEAMRRAAEQADDTELTDYGPQAVVTTAPAATTSEAFPVEMPERRGRYRVVQEPVPDVAPPTDGATEAGPVPGSAPAGEAPLRLMERIDAKLAEKIVVDQKTEPASREQYRRLAAWLHQGQAASGIKVVMIASAVPGEGKTLTAANLGLTFSESYQRNVLLIDADMRRPALHTVFGVDNSTGLSEGLLATAPNALRVLQFSPRLSIMPAGRHLSDTAAALTSERMRQLLEEAREEFDWVIIDTPPIGLLADANLLASMVDGALMVVLAGATSHQLVTRAVEALGRQRILGVVLNRAEVLPHAYGYDYANRYLSKQPEPALRP